MDQIEVREGARRQHRSLAMFCALYCWHHDKCAVFVEKGTLLHYLGLKRMKEKRYEWLVEDVNSYFSHIFKRKNPNGIDFIVFSKLPESELELVENQDAAKRFSPKVLDIAVYRTSDLLSNEGEKRVKKSIDKYFPFLSEINNLHEYALSNTLTLLANGVIQPSKALE